MLAFLSMVDRRKKLHRELTESLPATLPAVSDTAIPSASVVELMGVRRAPVVATLPRSPAAKAYVALWERVRDTLDALPDGARRRAGGRAPAPGSRAAAGSRGLSSVSRRLCATEAPALRAAAGPAASVCARVPPCPSEASTEAWPSRTSMPGAGERLGPLAAEQRAHVDLQPRAGGDLLPQQLVAAAEEAERALRVPDQQAEAELPDVGAGGEVRLVDARERHLEQDPARAGRAVGDDVELGRARAPVAPPG